MIRFTESLFETEVQGMLDCVFVFIKLPFTLFTIFLSY